MNYPLERGVLQYRDAYSTFPSLLPSILLHTLHSYDSNLGTRQGVPTVTY